jgi:hypothetical protein
MIAVQQMPDGSFQPIAGNPVLLSLDGNVRAPLRVILHESWTAEERAAFGVYLAKPVTVPDGKVAIGSPTYQRSKDGTVIEVNDLADVPADDTTTSIINIARALPAGHLVLVGLAYPVIITQSVITIGCEAHPASTWATFDDDKIAAMDGLAGSRFWRDYGHVILKLAGVI